MLKSYGWWGGVVWWVAHEILVSAQGPLFLGFGAKGLGPGLDNNKKDAQGLCSFRMFSSLYPVSTLVLDKLIGIF